MFMSSAMAFIDDISLAAMVCVCVCGEGQRVTTENTLIGNVEHYSGLSTQQNKGHGNGTGRCINRFVSVLDVRICLFCPTCVCLCVCDVCAFNGTVHSMRTVIRRTSTILTREIYALDMWRVFAF